MDVDEPVYVNKLTGAFTTPSEDAVLAVELDPSSSDDLRSMLDQHAGDRVLEVTVPPSTDPEQLERVTQEAEAHDFEVRVRAREAD